MDKIRIMWNDNKWAILPLISCFFLNSTVYWFTQWVMKDSYHYDFTTDFDNQVPVIPWWVSVYVASYIFWAVGYWIAAKESRSHCGRLLLTDYISKLTCGVIFVLLPTTNVRPNLGDGFWDQWLSMIYAMDQPFNLFPSIHCLASWICFATVRDLDSVSKEYKVFALVFALLVCASTQFTKQHYIIDVFGGILIAEAALFIAKKWKIKGKLVGDILIEMFP